MKNINYFITGVICLLIGIAIGFIFLKSGIKKSDIKWKFGDNELNINLEQDLVDASAMLSKIFSEDFSKKGTIAWLKENQNLYLPTDPDLVSTFTTLKYDHLVSKELRELSIRRVGPWSYQYDTVLIGIPAEEDQPKEGFANVCENGDYFTQRLRILTMDQTLKIEVIATGKYECPAGLKFPDIQLNATDAKKLLGTINFSKYEQGIALILKD